MTRHTIAMWLLVVCLSFASVEGRAQTAPKRTQPDVDAEIRYYSGRISEHPNHYPAFAQLAGAYLDKARQTHDPAYLAKARTALHRSMEIMPNFLALKTMTAVYNFSHRFEEGLKWGKQAAETVPTDTGVTAMLVEANLGLGRYEEAEKLLPPADTEPADFYTAAALGNYLVSQRRDDEAVKMFLKAADLAQAEEVTRLVIWAKVRAAGVLLDSGRPDQARPHLDAAAHLDPDDTGLRLHWAEFLQAKGRSQEALDVYEALLQKQPDPELHRAAFAIARKLDQESRASLHFKAAEDAFKRAIEVGEIYTLGALAQLYCDAEVNLDRALGLAQRNLEYKRDVEARTTLDCVRRKLGR